ncbi:solute carrier organic anion transporter family member 2A1-like, partial [Pomacea canaliculata]|uniref:solute carrier organic anion transporter family member 2A1-like n=1 Tax=Pomacea canaliculata TaxID=400727 RepID=UPI000D72C684
NNIFIKKNGGEYRVFECKTCPSPFSLSTDDDFSASVKDDDIPRSDVKELSEQKEQLTAKVSTGLPEVEDVDLFIDLPGKRGEGKAKRFWTELRTKSAFTFTLAAALILLTHINLVVFIVTQITTLERQFGLTSAQSGQIFAANEIGYLTLTLPASHFAARWHVPRALFVSAVVLGVSGAMCGLPHFLFPESEIGPNISTIHSAAKILPAFCVPVNGTDGSLEQMQRCHSLSEVHSTNQTVSSAEPGGGLVYSESAYPVLVYIIIFQVIRGMFGSPRMAMITTYLDDNCKKSDTGFYMGILAAVAMLGPAVAFIGGGAISKLHVSLQPTSLTPEHPDWVGAWWLGFLVFGLLAAVVPLPLLAFPRRLSPGPPRHENSKESGRILTGHRVLQGALSEMKAFVRSMAGLASNPVFLCIVLSSCFASFSMNGLYRFMPKILEEQFQLPAWKANFIMGGAELLMGTSGFFVGGIMTRRLKPSLLGLFKIVIIILFVSILLVCAQLSIGCPEPTLIGEPGTDAGNSNLSACVASCSCPDEVAPVCGDGASYFSPCHAGCSDQENGVYVNCTCVPSGRSTPGLCQSECTSVYPFAVIFYVLLFILSVSGPHDFLRTIRAVPEHQRALAVGTNGFAASLSGFLIGPLVYGRLIDTFCQHWRSPCGATGACSVYNLQRFRVNLHLYTVAAMILGLLLDVVGFLILKYGKRFVPSEVLHANTEPKPDAVAMPTNINADTNDHMENSGAEFHQDSNAAEEGLEMLPKNTPGENRKF